MPSLVQVEFAGTSVRTQEYSSNPTVAGKIPLIWGPGSYRYAYKRDIRLGLNSHHKYNFEDAPTYEGLTEAQPAAYLFGSQHYLIGLLAYIPTYEAAPSVQTRYFVGFPGDVFNHTFDLRRVVLALDPDYIIVGNPYILGSAVPSDADVPWYYQCQPLDIAYQIQMAVALVFKSDDGVQNIFGPTLYLDTLPFFTYLSPTQSHHVSTNYPGGDSRADIILPTAGTLSEMFIQDTMNAGGVNVILQKNGVDTAASIGSANGDNWSGSIALVAGDKLRLRIANKENLDAVGVYIYGQIAYHFTPTTDFEQVHMHTMNMQETINDLNNQSGFNGYYIPLKGNRFDIPDYAKTAADKKRVYHRAPTTMQFKNLYVEVENVVPAGGTFTFTLWKNGSPTSLTVSISPGSNSGNDTANTVSVVPGDILHFFLLKTTSHELGNLKYSYVTVANIERLTYEANAQVYIPERLTYSANAAVSVTQSSTYEANAHVANVYKYVASAQIVEAGLRFRYSASAYIIAPNAYHGVGWYKGWEVYSASQDVRFVIPG